MKATDDDEIHTIARIDWLDSGAISGWCTKDDLYDANTLIRTAGWIIAEGEDYVTVTTSVGPSANGRDTLCMDPLTIPRCAILRIRKFDDGDEGWEDAASCYPASA